MITQLLSEELKKTGWEEAAAALVEASYSWISVSLLTVNVHKIFSTKRHGNQLLGSPLQGQSLHETVLQFIKCIHTPGHQISFYVSHQIIQTKFSPCTRITWALIRRSHTCQTDMVLFSPEASAWCEVTNGRLADLPLQRLSRTHRGWQMARDGFWSPPPGDVSAGCQTDTPDTWTASAGGAALVPAPRYHGNLLCNGTLVHLVNRFVRRERWGKCRRFFFIYFLM